MCARARESESVMTHLFFFFFFYVDVRGWTSLVVGWRPCMDRSRRPPPPPWVFYCGQQLIKDKHPALLSVIKYLLNTNLRRRRRSSRVAKSIFFFIFLLDLHQQSTTVSDISLLFLSYTKFCTCVIKQSV